MANTLSVTSLLLEKILFKYHQKNSFLAPDLSVRDYVEYYDHKKNGGYFTGDSVRIRLPNILIPSQGWTVTSQGVQESEVTLTLLDPINVGTSFVSNEAQNYLDIEGDSYLERVAEPAAKGIMAKTNQIVADAYNTAIWHYVGDATAGFTNLNPFYQAESLLNVMCGVDRGGFTENAFACMHPYAHSELAPELLAKFLPSTNEGIYHKGRLGMVNDIEVMKENATIVHQSYTGSRAGVTVKTVTTPDPVPIMYGTSLTLTGFTPSTNGIVKAGDLFSISASKKVNPLTKVATTYGATFVAKADAASDSNGNCTVTVQPFDARPTVAGAVNPFQDLNRGFYNGDAVTFVGSCIKNIVWLKPMLTLVFPPLKALNKGAESESKLDPENKIWIRYSAQDFVNTSSHTRRIDVRPGVLWRGEQAVIMVSKIPT